MRTTENIINNPQLGDELHGRDAGRKSRHIVVWVACPKCGKTRWLHKDKENISRQCRSCYLATRINTPRPPSPKTIKLTDIPKVGDIIRGRDIGRVYNYFQWVICPDCYTGRWVAKHRNAARKRCTACGNEFKKEQYIGIKSSQWKGGRIRRRHGYFGVRVRPTSPYFPMADHIGYIPEHRLVMARHLGRCLDRSEIVHHCHTKFPVGSDKDRGDNRIENLKLVQHKDAHDAITSLERQVRILKAEVESLKTKNKLNEWRIKELESITQGYSRRPTQE